MTAQIGDGFIFENSDYSLIAKTGSFSFSPIEYGIIPESACTACWRGFWCVYKVSDKCITVDKLYVNSSDNKYPEINGVFPSKIDGDYLTYMGHKLYDGLNIKLPYTGCLLVGKNFMYEYYIHMGYQKPWAYKRLYELKFENGFLIEKKDQSDVAKNIRKQLKKEDKTGERSSIFSRNYNNIFKDSDKNKPWWL